MTKEFKTIGILGGIGPSASASMYSRIIQHMQKQYGAWDDADFPKIMVYSASLAGFDEYGIADPELVSNGLVSAVKKLEEMGSELVVVACNTVHYFDKQMEQAIKVPLVHMIDEACKDVMAQGYKKVGIACSQSTRDLKLYSDCLTKLGIEPVVSSAEEQTHINDVIMDVMAGKQGQHSVAALNKVFSRYKQDGAEAVILGCTELPLAITQDNSEVNLLDANDIVVRQAIQLAIK